MHRPPKPIDDPVMRKLVALMQEQRPNSAHTGRLHLLEQLHALKQEALESGADPGTLRSIHATQDFVRRSDPLMTASTTTVAISGDKEAH